MQVMIIIDSLGEIGMATISGTENAEPLFATKVEKFVYCPFEVEVKTIRLAINKETPRRGDPWRVSVEEGFEILESYKAPFKAML